VVSGVTLKAVLAVNPAAFVALTSPAPEAVAPVVHE
jgi:hypothetical protein